MSRIKIASEAELGEGKTIKFPLVIRGRRSEGFVARFQGKLVAYENRCRHLPLSLDYHDGRFFSGDGQHFVCHTHNATYEPLTGLCVLGPCEGQSLKALKLDVVDGDIWVEV